MSGARIFLDLFSLFFVFAHRFETSWVKARMLSFTKKISAKPETIFFFLYLASPIVEKIDHLCKDFAV